MNRIQKVQLDNTVRIFDAVSLDELLVIRGHTSGIHDVVWSPDGHRLASASEDGSVKIWIPEQSQASKALPGRMRAAWSRDGRGIVTVSDSSPDVLRIIDATSGQPLRELGESNRIRGLEWSYDDRRIAGLSKDGTLRIWDSITGELLLHEHHPDVDARCVAWRPDNRVVATSGYFGVITIWDAASGERLAELEGHELQVGSLAWSPDGRWLASASWLQDVILWDSEACQQRFVWDRSALVGSNPGSHSDGLVGLDWSPDGGHLVAGSGNGNIYVWDVVTGEEVHRMRGHNAAVRCVSWSPDGQRIASGARDRTIHIWDATSGRELLVIDAHANVLESLAWSPDGTGLLSADGKTLKLWEAPGIAGE